MINIAISLIFHMLFKYQHRPITAKSYSFIFKYISLYIYIYILCQKKSLQLPSLILSHTNCTWALPLDIFFQTSVGFYGNVVAGGGCLGTASAAGGEQKRFCCRFG